MGLEGKATVEECGMDDRLIQRQREKGQVWKYEAVSSLSGRYVIHH